MKFRFIDLFCGGGGLSLGFKMAGFNHVFGVDNWSIAAGAYTQNVGQCIHSNIKEFKGIKGMADMVIGSPPCQKFSKANIKDRTCDITLTNEFLRVVAEVKPKIWIMENVPEVSQFVDAPYKYIFDMSEFGLLQSRRRFFASNVPLEIKKENHKYLSEEHIRKLVEFRKEAVHLLYQTIHSRYNSFDKTCPKIRDKKGVRLLNHIEALQIQTFPFYYKLPDTTQRNIEKLIGNAVPPLFAYKLAKSIKC